jgi:hypothetical protein
VRGLLKARIRPIALALDVLVVSLPRVLVDVLVAREPVAGPALLSRDRVADFRLIRQLLIAGTTRIVVALLALAARSLLVLTALLALLALASLLALIRALLLGLVAATGVVLILIWHASSP